MPHNIFRRIMHTFAHRKNKMHTKCTPENIHSKAICAYFATKPLKTYTMRHLLLSCISLLLCFNCWPSSPIKLVRKNHVEDNRYSVPTAPTITYRFNTICINSEIMLPNLIILVSDAQGNIIYAEPIAISADIPYTIILPEMESGVYTIELISDEYHFSGNLFH